MQSASFSYVRLLYQLGFHFQLRTLEFTQSREAVSKSIYLRAWQGQKLLEKFLGTPVIGFAMYFHSRGSHAIHEKRELKGHKCFCLYHYLIGLQST